MIRVIADHNFDGRIIRGLISRVATLDLATARSVGLGAATDPQILAWANQKSRVLFTHDIKTMPMHIRHRAEAEESTAGAIIVPQSMGVGRAIEDLQIVIECGDDDDWKDRVLYLPL